ncbi:MAG: trypsin-like peptidase domain-containing protein [Planctomycetota bacterium]
MIGSIRHAAAPAALLVLALLLVGPAPLAAQEKASLDDLAALELELRALTAKIVPVTVNLRIGNAEGSGVIVTADGYVATAAHVFDRPGQRARVRMHDGRVLSARTLGRQERADYGLLKIEDKGPFPFAEMGDSNALERGQLVVATGHPGGFVEGRRPPLRFGSVLDTRGPFLRTDCIINSGDSGGPLFDLEGRVVGIHSRIRSRTNENYHVPIARVRTNWQRLTSSRDWDDGEGEFPPGPIVGVYGRDTADRDGCLIEKVYQDLPADKAGLLPGDVIRKIGDAEVKGVDDLVRAIRKHAPGDAVSIALTRRGEEKTIELVLGESPNKGGSR